MSTKKKELVYQKPDPRLVAAIVNSIAFSLSTIRNDDLSNEIVNEAIVSLRNNIPAMEVIAYISANLEIKQK